MAKKGVSVGVEITGSAKGFKAAAEDAKKATTNLEREARAKSRQIEQNFKMVTIAVAKIGAAIIVAKKAFEVFKTVMNSTEGSADKFREATDYAKGSLDGLFRTITTGSWDNLIRNVKDAATATRDFGKSIDELEDRIAGDTITLGQWERKLQSARLVYAEFKDTDPIRAGKALEDAIFYQRQITALTVQELKERAAIDEEYYAKLSDQSKEYFNYLLTQLPLIAQNQRMLLDPTYIEGLRKQISGLEYIKQLGPAAFTESKKAELQVAKLALHTIEDFIMLRDEMSKPGQFNAYIESLGKIQDAMAIGDEELVRLIKQQATLKRVTDNTTKSVESLTRAIHKNTEAPSTTIPKGILPGDPGALRISSITDDPYERASVAAAVFGDELKRELSIVQTLEGAFIGFFQNAEEGWKNMAKSAIASIEQIAAQIAARTAIFGIFSALFPGSAIVKGGLGSFLKGIFGLAEGGIVSGPTLANVGEYAGAKSNPEVVAPLSKLKGLMGTQKVLVTVKGKFTGKDIYLAGEQWAETLNNNT